MSWKPALTIAIIGFVAMVWVLVSISKSCTSKYNLKSDGGKNIVAQVINVGRQGPTESQYGLYMKGRWDKPLTMITNQRCGSNALKAWEVATPEEIAVVQGELYLCYYPADWMYGDTEWKYLDPPHDAQPELVNYTSEFYPHGDIGIGELKFSKPGRYAFVAWDKGVYLFDVKAIE